MKLLISFTSAVLFIALFTVTTATSFAATTETTTTVTTTVTQPTIKLVSHCKKQKQAKHKHKRHYKKNDRVKTYYDPGYCEVDSSGCGETVCYPGRYYQCKTEYYYHRGHNTARVETCNWP